MTVDTAAMDASHPLWVEEWKEGAGERTIRQHSKPKKEEDSTINSVVCYCSWFCPFAQRAWIALEELDVDYVYQEINPYRVDPNEPGGYTKQSLSFQEKRALFPDFMDTSPRGLVPAIQDVHGERIWESAVVVEYLDQVYGSSNNNRLYTNSAEGAALVRIYVEHCTTRIQKSYYQFLMEPTVEGQAKAKQEFFRECRALACAMAPNTAEYPSPDQILQETEKALAIEEGKGTAVQRVDMGTLSRVSQQAMMQRLQLEPGPFFLGAHFSAVDIALAPFWQRILWVGHYYRDLCLPNDAAFVRLEQWWQAVSQRPSVANTLVGKERLISSYKQYAHNTATSDVANSMKSSLTTENGNNNGSNNNNNNKRQKV